MKRIVSLLLALSLAATIPLALGAEAKSTKRAGTPEDSVFIFGCVMDANMIRYTQLDPEFEPAYYQFNHSYYFFEDVEPGSYLKLTTFEHNGPAMFTTYYIGFSGRTALDIRVPTKPGLYYAGYVDFSEMKKKELIFLPVKKYTEVKLLKFLLPSVKNKSWVPVIESRIKELENGSK